jgi:hypothetical protein
METNLPTTGSLNRILSHDQQSSGPGAFPENPFVGLRPFKSDEGLLFFGRREQTLELLQQLQQSRFLSIVGSSGCGKSSLIRAGLIPKLQAGFLVEQRDQWRVATAKPGDAPVDNLAQALVEAFPEGSDTATLAEAIRMSCTQAVIEFLTVRLKESDANLLLLIDQFEELFTFGRYGEKEITEAEDARDKDVQLLEKLERERRRDEAADYVTIMLGLAQTDLPVYVVMTMRSDFLGDCDVFYGLPEAMNSSQYLVPRLIRPQRQEAIENPILLYGKTISQRLLDRVLNDAGEEADQLPVMQHAMMRAWDKWHATDDPTLDLKHYEAAGTMKQALSNDAEEALAGMSGEDVNLTKRLFQTLTDNDPRGRRIRRPTHLMEIEEITGASREKLLEIISHFVSHGRSFLHLSQNDADPLVDISHESLIRQWARLRDWVTEESRYKDLYLRLVGMANRYYKPEPEDELLRGPALQFALDWKEKRKPNQAWANRYHPALAQTLRFLDESKARRDQDLAEAEQRRKDELERERRELEAAQLLAEQKQRFAESETAARKKELDAALAMATQRETAARWQRRAIYGLAFLLLLAIATTVFAVAAGRRAERRKVQAEAAEKKAADLSLALAGNLAQLNSSLEKEKSLKSEIQENLKTEAGLKDEAVKLKNQALTQAARANNLARAAVAAAGRERQALRRAEQSYAAAEEARAAAEKSAADARDNADKARRAEVKALATQTANQQFREGLTLARTNNQKAAEAKYKEAAVGYQSLPEPDLDGEATVYMELADMYLRSEDSRVLTEGTNLLEKAGDIFEKLKNQNGSAAVYIKNGDFYWTNKKILEDASDEEIAGFRYLSSLMYRAAFESYNNAKNLAGLVATSDKFADFHKTSKESEDLHVLISLYQALLPYYEGKELAPDKVSVYLKIGETHARLNESVDAGRNFEDALNVYRKIGDKEAKEGEAKTAVDIGFVLGGENIKTYTDKGLALVANDALAEANTLRYIGNKVQKRWSMGPTSRPGFTSEPAQAADYYTKALRLYETLPNADKQKADTLSDLGTINLQIDKAVALDNFQKACALYTEKEERQKATLLFSMGSLQEEQGQLDAALKSYEEADALFKKEKLIDELRSTRAVDRVRKAIEKRSGRQ